MNNHDRYMRASDRCRRNEFFEGIAVAVGGSLFCFFMLAALWSAVGAVL